jgi:hypothetical protein
MKTQLHTNLPHKANPTSKKLRFLAYSSMNPLELRQVSTWTVTNQANLASPDLALEALGHVQLSEAYREAPFLVFPCLLPRPFLVRHLNQPRPVRLLQVRRWAVPDPRSQERLLDR